MASSPECAWSLTIAPVLEPFTIAEAKAQIRSVQSQEDGVVLGYIKAARAACESYLGRGLLTQTWTLGLSEFVGVIPLPMAAPLQNDAAPQAIVSNTLANPTVVTTSLPHGLTAATAVTIAGNSGSSPTINGAQTATPLTATTFSVAVNCTVAGTGGTWVKAVPVTAPIVRYYDVDGTQQTLASTYYDVDTQSRPGRLAIAASQTWPSLYSLRAVNRVEIQYVVGWTTAALIPEDIRQGMRVFIGLCDADRDGMGAGTEQALRVAKSLWTDRVFWTPPA